MNAPGVTELYTLQGQMAAIRAQLKPQRSVRLVEDTMCLPISTAACSTRTWPRFPPWAAVVLAAPQHHPLALLLARNPEKPRSSASPEGSAWPATCRAWRGRPCLRMATLAQQPQEECRKCNGHILQAAACAGRQEAEMAAHECGFCLAASEASWSQDRGC